MMRGRKYLMVHWTFYDGSIQCAHRFTPFLCSRLLENYRFRDVCSSRGRDSDACRALAPCFGSSAEIAPTMSYHHISRPSSAGYRHRDYFPYDNLNYLRCLFSSCPGFFSGSSEGSAFLNRMARPCWTAGHRSLPLSITPSVIFCPYSHQPLRLRWRNKFFPYYFWFCYYYKL